MKNEKKQDIYQMVTNKLMEEMKNGIIPWQRPWGTAVGGAISHGTGKAYSLLNQMVLGREGEWLTYNEVQNEGGRIRRGEKASIVCFWKRYVFEEENEEGEKVERMVPVLRSYNVWHIDQVEGIKPRWERGSKGEELEPVEAAEKIVEKYFEENTVKLHNQSVSSRAYYSPVMDEVVVPQMKQYEIVEEYYSTLFHEMIHSTGHQTRLARKEVVQANIFGSMDYSKEELVAEMGASYLCAVAGLDSKKAFRNSVAYLQSWMKVLKNDPKMIIFAASKAEAAAKYVLNNEEA